jgi:hypothetical protein
MSITVADLKSIMDIGVTAYDEMFFYYNDGSDELIPIDDVGSLTLISNDNISDKDTSNFLSFIANGVGSFRIEYSEFDEVLDSASDTDLVYFVNRIQSLPQVDKNPVAINYAKLEVDRLSGLSSKSPQKTTGILTIYKNALSSSSSSSSSI